jgi:pimeloyl-ACP methyl ester carboxylesterase
MQQRIGHGVLESIAAESPKFTAPMLLIHGLWCTAAVWHRFMGYLAHRGWDCHAVNLHGPLDSRSGRVGRIRFEDYLRTVRAVMGACDAAPIVVGHDLGGLLALCSGATARATVALAPLVPRSLTGAAHPALSGVRARLAMLRTQPLPVARGRVAAAYFGHGVPGGVAPDSAIVARELTRADFRLPGGSGVPALVLAGGRDPISPPAVVEKLAQHLNANFWTVEGAGHAMPWETGWEGRVSEIHRWLIKTLGDPLLVVREDE